MKLAHGFLVGSLVFAAASGADIMAPEDLPPDLQAQKITDASAQWVVRDAFSYPMPEGFVVVEGIPIDSDALTHARGDDHLHHDFGWYSGPWTRNAHHDVSEVREAWVLLGGRRAQLVSYRLGSRYVVRAWWENVERSRHGESHLVVQGESDTPAGRQELLSVIHSVRFH
jgi:hypothetical protein